MSVPCTQPWSGAGPGRPPPSLEAERLEGAVHDVRDGVVVVDAGGVVRCLNPVASRLLGLAVREVVGRPWSSVGALEVLRRAVERPVGSDPIVALPGGAVRIHWRSFGEAPLRELIFTLVETDGARARALVRQVRYTFDDVVGAAPALLAAVRVARQAAEVSAPVLITGESGTGKEVIAQAIHAAGARAREPFLAINCAALPRDLLEAELFGYERGAFTGAREAGRLGKLQLAGHGTVLLDEIGDMPLDMQCKLLRVLEERVVTPLGGHREVPMHARILACTHRDLDASVREGRFRLDLYYRLRVLTVKLPPLRARAMDVPVLLRHYLRRFAAEQAKELHGASASVIDALSRYAWPGNVRELANLMEAEVTLAPADAVTLTRLASRHDLDALAPSVVGDEGDGAGILPMAELERRAYLAALNHFRGNVQRAAEALGITRVTFYARLKRWGIEPGALRPSAGALRARGRPA